MVRRHLLPPGKFETFQPINTINNITVNNINTVNNNQQQNNYQQQKQSDMARIIPKSLTINSQSHQSVSSNVMYLSTPTYSNQLKSSLLLKTQLANNGAKVVSKLCFL